jgi:hypothetical protein
MKVVLWRRSTWHGNKIPGSQSCLTLWLLNAYSIIFHHIHHYVQYSPLFTQVHPSTNLRYRQKRAKMWSIFRSKLRSSPQFLQHLQLDWPPVGSQGSPLRLRKDAKTNGTDLAQMVQKSPKIIKNPRSEKKTPTISYLCCCSSGCLNLGKFAGLADVGCHRMSQVHSGLLCTQLQVLSRSAKRHQTFWNNSLKYVEMMKWCWNDVEMMLNVNNVIIVPNWVSKGIKRYVSFSNVGIQRVAGLILATCLWDLVSGTQNLISLHSWCPTHIVSSTLQYSSIGIFSDG